MLADTRSAVPDTFAQTMSAQKMTLSVADKARLSDLKQIIDNLPNGITKINMKIIDGDKEALLSLPRGIRLGPDTLPQLSGLGIKVDIE